MYIYCIYYWGVRVMRSLMVVALAGMLVVAPTMALAKGGQSGSSNGIGGSGGAGNSGSGNSGNGVGNGGSGNQGSNGTAAGNTGGSHGGGNGGGNNGGGTGGSGGGSNAGGGAGTTGGGSVSTPGGSTGNAGEGAQAPSTGSASLTGRAVRDLDYDLKECSAVPGANGLVSANQTPHGFSYGGYEFALPFFTQCMLDRGYTMSTPGMNGRTNFGTR